MQKILVLLSSACGVGKSTIVEKIENEYFNFYEADKLGINWWDYASTENPDKYNEDAIKIAAEKENNKHIVFVSCLNPFTLFEKINLPSKIEKTYCISLTCSNEEIIRRLKERDPSRMCSSDEFIKGQIDYNQWFIKNANKFQLHIDNSNLSVNQTIEILNRFLNQIINKKQKKFLT